MSLQAKDQDAGWDSGNIGQERMTFDQNNIGGGVPGTLTVPTAGIDVDLSSLALVGWARFKNLDPDNIVQHGPKVAGTFHPYGRMKPGEPAQFRIDPQAVSGGTVHLKADTAACLVQVIVHND